jgi:hypothetical protein
MARKYANSPLTTLSHHIDLRLRAVYGRVRRDGAPGIDGVNARLFRRLV